MNDEPEALSNSAILAACEKLNSAKVTAPAAAFYTTKQAKRLGFTLPMIEDMRKDGVMIKNTFCRVID